VQGLLSGPGLPLQAKSSGSAAADENISERSALDVVAGPTMTSARITAWLPIWLALACGAAAGEHSAETPECREITARLLKQTHTHFDNLSPSGGTAFFKNPDMVLVCDPKFVTFVSMVCNEGGFPPNKWFALLAAAGNAVTGVDPKRLEDGAHSCHRAALKDTSELADLDLGEAKIECQSFKRNGGGVVIAIAKPNAM
jgi:hypothetical protein